MVGEWLSDSDGWHNIYRVVFLAAEFGFNPGPDAPMVISNYQDCVSGGRPERTMRTIDGTQFVNDVMSDLYDRACEYLEDHAPVGHVLIWDTGSLYLLPVEGLRSTV
jgi:hypothetical protein